jgi:hypothetical protein
MASKLQKQAQALTALRANQQELVLHRKHKEVLRIGSVLHKHEHRIACAYLAVKQLPDGINAVLVREIAAECAALDSEQNSTLRSQLRRAAWSEDAQTTTQLEKAQQVLPDLNKVIEVLRVEE